MFKLYWLREVPNRPRYIADAISGNIYSKEYRHSGKPHLLKPFRTHSIQKYVGVNLFKDGKKGKVERVHRIIALTFPEICGNYFEGAVVNHKDENPENNSAFNLEWCTIAHNNSWSTHNERIRNTNIANGRYCGYKYQSREWRDYWNARAREKRKATV